MSRNIFIEMAHHPQVILDTMDQIQLEMAQMQQGADRGKRTRRMGCGGAFALLAAGALLFGLDIVLGYGVLCTALGLILGAMAVLLFFVALLAARTPRVLKRYAAQQQQFEAAYQILYALRDDTGRKGRVVGWLDLSGPRQPEKKVRTGRTRSGKPKVYYRDPWFQVKIKLADGNLLRLALVDKVKQKSGYVVGHYTQIKAKLVPNPDLYPMMSLLSRPIPLQGATLSDEDGVIVFTSMVRPAKLSPREILESLWLIYRHLEPVGPGPTLGAQNVGMDGGLR